MTRLLDVRLAAQTALALLGLAFAAVLAPSSARAQAASGPHAGHNTMPGALAAPVAAPVAAADLHPWLSAPVQVTPPETYFSNLKDGARIETPFLLKFGLSRFGLAPIVKPVPHTGHHHLMINRELPLDFTKPLPFNDQYIHFGKGQMETVLTFVPGTYTLRLLLADDKHIPYFVYSKPLTIVVTKKNDNVDPKSLIKPGVSLLAPPAGETQKPPFRVVFHATGLNVGHSAITEPGVGHFRLLASKTGGETERINFASGATEAWLAPPPGSYRFRLELIANAGGAVMATSAPLEVTVRP